MFSFIYKYFVWDTGNPAGNADPWRTLIADGLEDALENLLDEGYGVSELAAYLDRFRGPYPRLCHVIFWGDEGDGVANSLTRQNALRLVQDMLVRRHGWTVYFFDLAVASIDAARHRQSKSLLIADPRTRTLSPQPVAYPVWRAFPDRAHVVTDAEIDRLKPENNISPLSVGGVKP